MLQFIALTVAFAGLLGCGDRASAPDVAPVPVLTEAEANARTVVPLTRTVSLDKSGVIVDLDFDLPPPGPNADPTLVVGIRIEEQKAKAMLARSGLLVQGGLPAKIKLQRLDGTQANNVELTRIGNDLKERISLGTDGLTPGVRQESVNGAMLRDAGLIEQGIIYTVLSFGFTVDPPPGRYHLRVELLEERPQLKNQQADLIIAYSGKSK
ncbi:hypothetical protein ABRP17_010440 [Stenotrophomonas sp. WHRI 8082]|uniref:hypothetical protein n=1 Tax=Stenotrophomonas sp. WHRI 8082 TaxID=3162571 RepID=UPI0032EF15C1